MEIGSVGVNAYTQPSVQNERTQQAQQARQAEQAQPAPKAQQSEESAKPPVRNAEGQVTGQRINTSA